MSSGSILILENSEKISKTVEIAAERRRFHCQALPFSENIVPILQKNPVDVLLINTRQAGSNIRAVCSIIREDHRYKSFPLIILYGRPGKETRMDYLKSGADDYVTMPFAPMELMFLIETRLRPLRNYMKPDIALSGIARNSKSAIEIPNKVQPLEPKGSLEEVPLTRILSRLFFSRKSGCLTLIIKKEIFITYFENGNIVFTETRSKRDDLGEFMARNNAGKGSGKDVIAARTQAGGPGCDPREFRKLLKEVDLIRYDEFSYWARLHAIAMLSSLFSRPLGTYHFESLPLPDHVAAVDIDPIYTPRLISAGIRSMTKWWAHREMLPNEAMVPIPVAEFHDLGNNYGFTNWELSFLTVANGYRDLQTIRDICHKVAKPIDNYLFCATEMGLFHFVEASKVKPKSPDLIIEAKIDEDIEPNSLDNGQLNSTPKSDGTASDLPDNGDLLDILGAHSLPSPEDESTTGNNAKFIDTWESELSAEPIAPPKKPITETLPKREPIPAPPPRLQLPEIPDFDDVRKGQKWNLKTGNIADLPIPELFMRCMEHGFSGCMSFENSGIAKSVFWKRGKIITATSNDIDERLDNFLYRKHTITAEQREQLRKGDPDKIGSPNELLKQQILNIEQMFIIVKEQVVEMLFDLFNWNSGTFESHQSLKPPQDAVPMDISPESIIMNGLQKLYSWNHLEDRLPVYNERVRINKKKSFNQSGLSLTPLELRIMNVLVEPLPVSEVIRRVEGDSMQTRRSLYAMEIAGFLLRTRRNSNH